MVAPTHALVGVLYDMRGRDAEVEYLNRPEPVHLLLEVRVMAPDYQVKQVSAPVLGDGLDVLEDVPVAYLDRFWRGLETMLPNRYSLNLFPVLVRPEVLSFEGGRWDRFARHDLSIQQS